MSSIHWFRKGLRIHDNPALLELTKLKDIHTIYPIFILDPYFVQGTTTGGILSPKVGVRRWKFLLETLDDLDCNLKKKGSRLFVFRGDPNKILPKLIQATSVVALNFEQDTEPYAIYRDESIKKAIKENTPECKVTSFCSHTLFNPEDLLQPPKTEYELRVWKRGIPPLTYKGFISKALGSEGNGDKVPLPSPDIKSIQNKDAKDHKKLLKSLENIGFDSDIAGPKGDFGVPTTEELKLKLPPKEEASPHKGGESIALERMKDFIKDTKRVLKFKKPDTAPTDFYPNASTTILSPYLKFGSLSARTFHQELWKIESKARKEASKPPESLRGQLLWREFFYTCGYAVPNFDKMTGNPICLKNDWECPNRGDTNSKLEAWKEAKTGFPWIDAAMTQLRKEGWIHHLARHAVACFLTRGHLYVSWERGAEVFEELLLDADWSLNSANWMWLSASAFFKAYFRVYSPIVFPKKTDPDGKYVRHWIPALKNMPNKYIYEPWKAPIQVQREAKCIIGKDYPKPIVIHEEVREANLAKMKEAYQENDHGDPAELEPGSKRKSRS